MSIFFFNHTPTTEIYTLSLHDALPICDLCVRAFAQSASGAARLRSGRLDTRGYLHPDRKSTRLNSSHANISYAVFCLKKKKLKKQITNKPQIKQHNKSSNNISKIDILK